MMFLVHVFMLGIGPFIAASLHIDQRSNVSNTLSLPACTSDDVQSKEFDIILYGATGFVGELAVEYLSTGIRGTPRWAIAGRDHGKLRALFDKYRRLPEKACSAMIVASTNSMEDMLRLAMRTKTIVNFAGPYESYGAEEMIRSAINGCAHYVDLAAETHWKAYIMKKYHKMASERGVAIVQSAGFYSMAADFVSVAAATDVVKYTKVPPEQVLIVYTKLNGQFTGGQKASMAFETGKYGNPNDPYLLSPASIERKDTQADGFSKVQGAGKIFGWDRVLHMMLEDYKNAGMDCNVVRRSMSHLFHQSISVLEARNASVDIDRVKYTLDPSRAFHPKYPEHPFPGTGPEEWLRDLGSATIVAYAYRQVGEPPFLSVTLEENGDPASVASPKMAVEMARLLAQNGPQNAQGGYLTTASVVPIQQLQKMLNHVDDGAVMKIRRWNLTSVR